jgi:hypothetical protein
MQSETTTYVNNEIRTKTGNISNNMKYREFLKTNTMMIMKINYQNVIQENPSITPSTKKTYPYLFYGIDDNSQPYGYENTLPKQMYISQQQLENNKRRIFTTI